MGHAHQQIRLGLAQHLQAVRQPGQLIFSPDRYLALQFPAADNTDFLFQQPDIPHIPLKL